MTDTGDKRILNGDAERLQDFGGGKEPGPLIPFRGLHLKDNLKGSNVYEGRVEHNSSLDAIHKILKCKGD